MLYIIEIKKIRGKNSLEDAADGCKRLKFTQKAILALASFCTILLTKVNIPQ